jgi:hypothetical protein
LCILRKPAQCVDQLHLLNRIAAGAKKKGRTDEISQALRVGDCCVEAMRQKRNARLRKTSSPLEVAIETPWSLLALKFIENQSV